MDPPEFVNMRMELVIQPEMFPFFEQVARSAHIGFNVSSEDLQSLIEAEKPKKNRKAGFALDQYNELDDIYQFLDEMQALHPDKATVFTVGESFEGRLIKGIKITSNDDNPAIFIEANIHAREWISSATSVWIINELLTTTDQRVKDIADSVTWYLVPVTNPDGS